MWALLALVFLQSLSSQFITILCDGPTSTMTSRECLAELLKSKSINELIEFSNKVLYEERLSDYILDSCLNIEDGGRADLKKLRELLRDGNQPGGVCQPSYVDKIIDLHQDMESHRTNYVAWSGKKDHGLSNFYKLYVSQIIKICKGSLMAKVREASKSVGFFESLYSFDWLSKKEQSQFCVGSILSILFKPSSPSNDHERKLEKLILVDEMERVSDIKFTVLLEIESDSKMKEFFHLKQACQTLDRYASNSIKPIARLAMHGFMDLEDSHLLSSSVEDEELLDRWVKNLQICQGILIAEVKLIVSPQIPDDASQEETIFTINIMGSDRKKSIKFDDHKCDVSGKKKRNQIRFRAEADKLFDRDTKLENTFSISYDDSPLERRIKKPSANLIKRIKFINHLIDHDSQFRQVEATLGDLIREKPTEFGLGSQKTSVITSLPLITYWGTCLIVATAAIDGLLLAVGENFS